MPSVLLSILAGNLPPGYCFPASPQQLLNDFSDSQSALLEGGQSFFNFGASTPAPENQIYPWLRTTDMRWYRFSGVWLSPNPEINLDVRRELFSAEAVGAAGVWAYDGGDGTDPAISIPTANTGAMWEVDHDFDGRSSMGPGAISGAVPPKTLILSEDYGTGGHSLIEDELGAHTHPLDKNGLPAVFFSNFVQEAGGDSNPSFSFNGSVPETSDVTGSTGLGDGHQTVHPVRGIFKIRRTARLNYVAS